VHEGERVAVGQPLGLAGNSGMSIEPHLHIQAHAKTFKGLPFYKEPQLLVLFNSREYRLFEEMKNN
jgi:murein DD-endopeptidase MepM/ murein hydrolase activator NlpD